jgi:translin
MEQARTQARAMVDGVKGYPELYYAGYTQDALKEFVEAYLTYALVRNQPLPPPDELSVEPNTWLNGLAEAATELRRRILDIIRHGYHDEVERLLDQMDEIYSILVTFDFSDSITAGLRRRTDVLRGVLERTRGDVTTSLRQAELEQALEALERKLGNV